MRQIKHRTVTYQIMHGDRLTACVDTRGRCRIYEPEFLPFSLYLEEEEEDFDILFNNLANFYFWCASRVLTLDRVYIKEILSSIGAPQAAETAARAVGLNQIREVEREWFGDREGDWEMFLGRLELLRRA